MSTAIQESGQYGDNGGDKTADIESQEGMNSMISKEMKTKDYDGWVERRVRSKWQVFRVSAKQSIAFSVLTTSLYFMVNRSRRKVPTKYLMRPTRKLFGLSLALSFSYLYYTYELESTHNALVNKLHNTWSDNNGNNDELREYGERMQKASGLHGSRK